MRKVDVTVGSGAVDVCLVVPPFAQVETPTLGAAVLAAACGERGLDVRTLHANVLLAARAGFEDYARVAASAVDIMVGERLFAPYAYPPETRAALDAPRALPAVAQGMHDAIAPAIGPFLDEVCSRILALAPRILGISTVFQQNLAASAIALRIKAAAPEICIVLGGANVVSPMGEALAEILPWIDYFFSGEADIAFPDFCESLIRSGARPAERVIHCPPLFDMSRSPAPAFDDYFADLRAAQADGTLPAGLPESLTIETSRGCWWGARHHCTFCGLNGETMAFREKPVATALAEIDALEAQWGVGRFTVADNIMPLRYLKELLPILAERETPPEMFYEVKANLNDAQLALMASAGINRIQPGIESLSSPVLRLMRKGVSAHQNLMLLRGCRALGIDVIWNYLHGFPGEQVGHYAPVAALIPQIEHLQPPNGFGGLLIDRFSPYFNTPPNIDITELAPLRAYRGLYPSGARLADIAYHFRGRYTTALLDDAETRRAMARAIGRWRLQWIVKTPPVLRVAETHADGAVIIEDTRRIAREGRAEISPAWDRVLRFLEKPHDREGLDAAIEPVAVELLARGYLIEHESKLLSVVVRSVEAGESTPEACQENSRGVK